MTRLLRSTFYIYDFSALNAQQEQSEKEEQQIKNRGGEERLGGSVG